MSGTRIDFDGEAWQTTAPGARRRTPTTARQATTVTAKRVAGVVSMGMPKRSRM